MTLQCGSATRLMRPDETDHTDETDHCLSMEMGQLLLVLPMCFTFKLHWFMTSRLLKHSNRIKQHSRPVYLSELDTCDIILFCERCIVMHVYTASYSLWWNMNTDMGSFPWNSSLQTDLNNPQYIGLALFQLEPLLAYSGAWAREQSIIICGLNMYFRQRQWKTDQAGTLGLGMVVTATSVIQNVTRMI